jgi:hypothetical protein
VVAPEIAADKLVYFPAVPLAVKASDVAIPLALVVAVHED